MSVRGIQLGGLCPCFAQEGLGHVSAVAALGRGDQPLAPACRGVAGSCTVAAALLSLCVC
jgi:hypothetical protein